MYRTDPVTLRHEEALELTPGPLKVRPLPIIKFFFLIWQTLQSTVKGYHLLPVVCGGAAPFRGSLLFKDMIEVKGRVPC